MKQQVIDVAVLPSFAAALNASIRALEFDALWEQSGTEEPHLQPLNIFLEKVGLRGAWVDAPLEQILEAPAAGVLAKLREGYGVLAFPEGRTHAVVIGADGLPSDAPLQQVMQAYTGRALVLHALTEGSTPGRDGAEPAYLLPLRAYWPQYLEIVLAGVGINFIALLTPFFSMLVYDKIIGNGITETLWALVAGMLLAALLDLVLRLIRAWYVEHIAQRSDAQLDRGLLKRVLHHNAAVLPPVGQVLNKYQEFTASRDFISSTYMLSVADMPFLLLFVIALWLIGGPIALVLVVVGALLVLTHALCGIPARDFSLRARRANASKIDMLAEILGEGELLKTSLLRVPVSRRWLSNSSDAAVAGSKGRFWYAAAASASSFWVTVCWVGTLVVGVYLIEAKALTTGGLVACTMLANRGMMSLASVMQLVKRFGEMRRSGGELNTLLADDSAGDGETATVTPRRIAGRLTVRRLGYRFKQDGPWVLEGLTFNIEPGERVGLIGRPGSGKTTLLRCLAGVVAPATGDILMDGVAVRQHDAYSRGRWIAYKPQEPMLFAGSLEDNIRAGADAVGQEALEQALLISGLGDAIRRGELHLGLGIEPRGVNLSGGQRQMVCLARALASAPNVLLLDEPTAGLDAASEQAIAARLREFSGGRTLVLATHSRALLETMDRLIVVEGGRIVADGPRERVLVG